MLLRCRAVAIAFLLLLNSFLFLSTAEEVIVPRSGARRLRSLQFDASVLNAQPGETFVVFSSNFINLRVDGLPALQAYERTLMAVYVLPNKGDVLFLGEGGKVPPVTDGIMAVTTVLRARGAQEEKRLLGMVSDQQQKNLIADRLSRDRIIFGRADLEITRIRTTTGVVPPAPIPSPSPNSNPTPASPSPVPSDTLPPTPPIVTNGPGAGLPPAPSPQTPTAGGGQTPTVDSAQAPSSNPGGGTPINNQAEKKDGGGMNQTLFIALIVIGAVVLTALLVFAAVVWRRRRAQRRAYDGAPDITPTDGARLSPGYSTNRSLSDRFTSWLSLSKRQFAPSPTRKSVDHKEYIF